MASGTILLVGAAWLAVAVAAWVLASLNRGEAAVRCATLGAPRGAGASRA